MKNFIQPGDTSTFTAPAGGVTTGGGYLIGALFVVATATVAAGLPFEGMTEGIFTLPKVAGEGVLPEGKPLYWDVANTRVSIDPSVGQQVGYVAVSALDADVTCAVLVDCDANAGHPLTIRKRFTIAQINAGATLLPALPGLKYRHLSSTAIAIGGAAAAVTTVDILATQAAASVKLAAFAQASLTRSTVLTAGGAGAAVLADGASYVANDVNTAVTVNKTGADVTTATHIDVSFTYMLE